MKRTGTSQSAAQCMKWRAGAVLALLPGTLWAQNLRSMSCEDPWLALAGPVLAGSAASAFHHGVLGKSTSLWCGGRRLFGQHELQSQGLALGTSGEWGRWAAGFHQLNAGFWREQQAVLRWSPLACGLQEWEWSAGIEWRRQSATEEGMLAQVAMPRLDLTWKSGPIQVQAGAGVAEGGTESHVAVGWRHSRGIVLTWQAEQALGRRRERVAVGWEHAGSGLGIGWREGRGWELAGRLRWKQVALGASWWNHPVLPSTEAWSLSLGGGQ